MQRTAITCEAKYRFYGKRTSRLIVHTNVNGPHGSPDDRTKFAAINPATWKAMR